MRRGFCRRWRELGGLTGPFCLHEWRADRRRRQLLGGLSGLASLFCFQSLLLAQPGEPLEEIIITADYRQTAADAITGSIAVIDESLMRAKNAQHLEEVLLNVPNVNFASGSSRARFIQMRGIGERGQFAEPLNPSVGLMIDGVDFSGLGAAALLYDVEQVEILMGPQGTRYGSNALAGLINLQSKAPAAAPAFGLQLQSANYQDQGVAAYASGPLSKRLLYRLSAQTAKSDGFSDNLFLHRPTNYRDETAARAKLRWLADPHLSLDLTATLADVDNGYDAFSLDNIRDTRSDQPGQDRQRSVFFHGKLSLASFEPFTVEALASHASSAIDYGYDEDWTYQGFHPYGYSSTDQYLRARESGSVELRLLSTEAGALLNGRSDWVIGIYSLRQQVDLERRYTFLASPFRSAYDIERRAFFADTSTALSDNWRLELGLRSERFASFYEDGKGVRFNPKDYLFGGKIALSRVLSGSALLYLSASRGYKSGGFNTDGSLDEDLRRFDPEALWNYEAGFKGSLLEGRLRTRLALFYMARERVQISSSTIRTRADGSSEFIDFIGNAAAGVNYGLELNVSLRASDKLRIYGDLGLLDAVYEDFINSAGEDLDGREQAHAPSYQFTLGAGLVITPRLHLDLNVQGRDKFYFSDSHAAQSASHVLLNASLHYARDNWRLVLWGRNLGDADYFTRGFYFGNDPRNGYAAQSYTQLGEPRRFGLTLNLDY